jgi:hypothetical protein
MRATPPASSGSTVIEPADHALPPPDGSPTGTLIGFGLIVALAGAAAAAWHKRRHRTQIDT